jgi:hypothetical protein
VRLFVDELHGFRIGRVREAEHRAARRVDPIGEEPDAITVLHQQVLYVGVRDRLGRHVREVVPVHERRHSGHLAGRNDMRQGSFG